MQEIGGEGSPADIDLRTLSQIPLPLKGKSPINNKKDLWIELVSRRKIFFEFPLMFTIFRCSLKVNEAKQRTIVMNPKKNNLQIDAYIRQLRRLKPIHKISKPKSTQGAFFDFCFDITLPIGRRTAYCKLKESLTSATIHNLSAQLPTYAKAYPENLFFLFAPYIPSKAMEELASAGFNSVDLAGDVRLKIENSIYIFITGKSKPMLSQAKASRLDQPCGLGLLFTLLTESAMVSRPYRELAKVSNISLGSTGTLMQELERRGNLIQISKNKRKLIRKRELFDLWIEGYRNRLRAKNLIGQYESLKESLNLVLGDIANVMRRNKIQWAITGTYGAYLLTHHYRSDRLTLIVETLPQTLLKVLRWMPSDRGRITLLKAFSTQVYKFLTQTQKWPVAHPLAIYAELMYHGGDREIETARILYETELQRLIHES